MRISLRQILIKSLYLHLVSVVSHYKPFLSFEELMCIGVILPENEPHGSSKDFNFFKLKFNKINKIQILSSSCS